MGTSHHEPMMRAQRSGAHGKGAVELRHQRRRAAAVLGDGVERTKDYENIITLGMRGDGDEPMSREANVALLEQIVADQRDADRRRT